jgi:hypothetical protein
MLLVSSFCIDVGPGANGVLVDEVVCFIEDLDIGIIDATIGEILRTPTLDTTRTYQPTGKPQGGLKGLRKPKNPNPSRGVRMPGMSRDITLWGTGGNAETLVRPAGVGARSASFTPVRRDCALRPRLSSVRG